MKKAPNEVDRHVGTRIRLRRTIIAMSQERLGEALGITFQQIQKYEKGTNRVSASRLQQISTVLGVGIDWFYAGGDGAGQRPPRGFSDGLGAAYHAETATDSLTGEALKLLRAFHRIDDERLRKKVIEIATVFADVATLPRPVPAFGEKNTSA